MVPFSARSRGHSIAFKALLLSIVVAAASGCFLFKKKKNSGGGSAGNSSALIVRTGILFDRQTDKSTAKLQFKTTRKALCELALYTQDDSIEPLKTNPKTLACSNPSGGLTDITVEIPDIRTDVLYFVSITAWDVNSSKEKGDVLLVKEALDPNNPVTPGVATDGKLTDLIVARLDMPLLSAEVHRHQLPAATDLATLRGKLARAVGCQVGVPTTAAPFRDAAKDITIKNLTTMDLGAGTAGPHSDYPEREAITYGSLNVGVNQWTFSYLLNNSDGKIVSHPVVTIKSIEMASTESASFGPPQLAEAEDPLKIDATKPLKFTWKTVGTLDGSYLTVQVGRPDYSKAIYCVFPAEAGTGSIDAKLLQGLDDGKQVVLAELTTNQLFAKEGWIVSLSDWRSGRIEK